MTSLNDLGNAIGYTQMDVTYGDTLRHYNAAETDVVIPDFLEVFQDGGVPPGKIYAQKVTIWTERLPYPVTLNIIEKRIEVPEGANCLLFSVNLTGILNQFLGKR